MEEALKEAHKALNAGEVPVGAIVVCKNKIIARAHNQAEKLTDATAHAEMLAVTTASYECTLYVTLEPCVMCAGALHWVQLQRLVIGAEDVQRGYSIIKSPLLHAKTEVVKGIKSADCSSLLMQFFDRIRAN
jgi:tRNA(adenine34) deaminase